MFVSSYSTYLHTNTTDKSTKKDTYKELTSNKSFNTEGFNSSQNTTNPLQDNPIDYHLNQKSLNTKAQIQQQYQENKQTNKFAAINSQVKASLAYSSSSTIFSLIPKSQPTIKPTTQIVNQNLPQDIKDIKESFLKIKMLNTYISNNNYYQITA